MEITILIVTLIGLIIGSYTDFKTREVPDWVNFGLIALGFTISLLLSIISTDWNYMINSVAGFLLCFIIGAVMFYTGQWGGGDSKMIMALGALIGINIFNIDYRNFSLISFLVNILMVGAVYGIAWSIALTIKNRKRFMKEAKKVFYKNKVLNICISSITALVLFVAIITSDFLVKINLLMIFIILLLYFLWHIIKIIENVCMLKYVSPDKLTEGDWIAEDVKINGKIITGPKDLGISKKQINQLLKFYRQKKIKRILIKEGIPFVPSFLIAFIMTYAYGNLVFLLI
ncbi:MAG: A24 family peptidase [Nanoarchaeota archaeon]